MTTTENPVTAGEASDGHRPACNDCGAKSPQTNTNYTLISQEHGWRLVFQLGAGGRRIAHWRCPECWDRHRKTTRR